MKEIIRNALILCGITVVSGLILGAAYEITKKPREEQAEKSRINAYKAVLSEASVFEELDTDMAKVSAILLDNGITEKNVTVEACIKATDDKKELKGYIITVTSKEGYGGNITFSVGFSTTGKVMGVSILSISETAGLGMEARDEGFLSQYMAQGTGMFVVNKAQGQDGINVDSISGATITTNAMTKGVNAAKLTAAYLLSAESDKENADVEADKSENESIENTVADEKESTDKAEGGEADE